MSGGGGGGIVPALSSGGVGGRAEVAAAAARALARARRIDLMGATPVPGPMHTTDEASFATTAFGKVPGDTHMGTNDESWAEFDPAAPTEPVVEGEQEASQDEQTPLLLRP